MSAVGTQSDKIFEKLGIIALALLYFHFILYDLVIYKNF